jgi:NAD(P)-dependent dehydrogenase (short-subunit alcohol dehydrogenase family)
MSGEGSAVIIGGTSGLGKELAQVLAARGDEVIITGRDAAKAQSVAKQVGGRTRGLAVDLATPEEIAGRLAEVGPVKNLIIGAIYRDDNSVRKFNVASAMKIMTVKLVGYAEVIHVLVPRFTPNASIVLFGGQAKERPYPGSTTVSTVNGGIATMVHTLAVELSPIRVNAIHPGIVGDSPAWAGRPPEVLERVRTRTPTGKLPTMTDVASAVIFLLENQSVNGVNLNVDGGWLLM